jgi:hypothetical protein
MCALDATGNIQQLIHFAHVSHVIEKVKRQSNK